MSARFKCVSFHWRHSRGLTLFYRNALVSKNHDDLEIIYKSSTYLRIYQVPHHAIVNCCRLQGGNGGSYSE